MSVKSRSTKPPKGYKKLQCKYCENVCERVDEKADAVTCWQCTSKLVSGQHLEVRK
jgi:ribosomal protein S27E